MTAPATSEPTTARADSNVTHDRRPRRGIGVAMMLGGAVSNQTGAAFGARAFEALDPIGVVAVRQLVAAAVLLPLARPPLRSLTWRQWWPCLLLAGVFATMNLALYTAIDRVGLGLAVTLEFLGPLAIALVGSRGIKELVAAVLAAAGVYVLILPGRSTDLIGLGLGLLAAVSWAGYILVNRVAGERLPGIQGPAVGSMVSAVAYLPVLVALGLHGLLGGWPLVLALTAGVLSSAVPYALDLSALRFVPQRSFGVFMSVNPALAALAGLLVLGQGLELHEWTGIAMIVLSNVIATSRRR